MIRLSTFACGASVFGVVLNLGACAPITLISPATTAKVAVVSTLAGSTQDFSDSSATTGAQFNSPRGVAVDKDGSVYVADTLNHRIRKITPAGAVSTLAGSTQGFADAGAKFSEPWGVAVDNDLKVYVGDQNNHRIRTISSSRSVETLAGGFTLSFGSFRGPVYGFTDGTPGQFDSPNQVALDTSGNVYVADFANSRIRKVTPLGNVSTFAGPQTPVSDAQGDVNGSAINVARFKLPRGVAVDKDGSVYVADTGNHRIRKVTPLGNVSTFAGSTQGYLDDTGTKAQFNEPYAVAVDSAGNIYVADKGNHRIRKITPAGEVTTLAGSGTEGFADGNGTAAQFSAPNGVAVDSAGNVYVADTGNHRIRKITFK